jgi:hypothetical protein
LLLQPGAPKLSTKFAQPHWAGRRLRPPQGAVMLTIALRFDFAKQAQRAAAMFRQEHPGALAEPLLEEAGEGPEGGSSFPAGPREGAVSRSPLPAVGPHAAANGSASSPQPPGRGGAGSDFGGGLAPQPAGPDDSLEKQGGH